MANASTQWWASAGGYVAELLSVLAREPEKPVLHYRGSWTTGGEHLRSVTGIYRVLSHSGVGHGTIVGVLTASNSPEILGVRHATHLLGAAVGHLRSTNPGSSTAMLPIDDQMDILRTVGAGVLYADRDAADRAAELARLAGISLIGPGVRGPCEVTPGDDPGPAEPALWSPEDLAAIAFTSGSTGRPKGIRKSRRSWDSVVYGTVDHGPEAEQVTALVGTPLSQTVGQLADAALIDGGRLVLLEEFAPDTWIRAVNEHSVTRTFMATSHLYRVLDHLAERGLHDPVAAGLTSLRRLDYAGSPAASARLIEAVKMFGPSLFQQYGTSESARISFLAPEDHKEPELLETVGRPFPGVEIGISDLETGASLGAGKVGEVRVRSPHVMDGYLDEALTAQVFRDGWYHTGDIGYRDERGYLHLLDRVADMVKIDGVKVYPTVIERETLMIPGIAQAVVYGCLGDDGLEHLYAAIALRAGALVSSDVVRAHLSTTLSPAHAPEQVLVLDEIPLNAAGKPDKPRLRMEHASHV
ncbi:class I adenylate-forming enzyme family protein [Amycolatopsis sp. H20-H5]|uniref:class I adenylate-forming enzyme family protein n=1 Tax=Amycolatopsis sp. H20-H5 TaxID=3046309 RepID=UPI002DBFC791|nr:fatty acid--CoA ligase family protein [Amycolatopsis sp. H20-H5]MEC3979807.1 fatty acid--CoA ligase family protein [Amycolatopsis sp. H20-H5]